MIESPAIPRARILVVEDEHHTLSGLVRALKLMGFPADGAANGQEAMQKLVSGNYDLVLLDLKLPDMHGVEIMQQARAAYPDLSFIILTAHGDLDSAIAAVRTQAVDYLKKPSSIEEIGAAVTRALQQREERLRHQHYLTMITKAASALQEQQDPTPHAISPEQPIIECGPLTLNRQQRIVLVDEGENSRRIELTTAQAKLLAYLMLYPDVTISCSELAIEALNHPAESEQAAQAIIRPHISRLRRKIEPNPDEPLWIHTRRKEGYCLRIHSTARARRTTALNN